VLHQCRVLTKTINSWLFYAVIHPTYCTSKMSNCSSSPRTASDTATSSSDCSIIRRSAQQVEAHRTKLFVTSDLRTGDLRCRTHGKGCFTHCQQLGQTDCPSLDQSTNGSSLPEPRSNDLSGGSLYRLQWLTNCTRMKTSENFRKTRWGRPYGVCSAS